MTIAIGPCSTHIGLSNIIITKPACIHMLLIPRFSILYGVNFLKIPFKFGESQYSVGMVLNSDRNSSKMSPLQFCITLLKYRPSYLSQVKLIFSFISFLEVLSLKKKICSYVSDLPHSYPPNPNSKVINFRVTKETLRNVNLYFLFKV